MQHIPFLVNHPQRQFLLVCRNDGETRFRTAKHGSFRGFHFAGEGAGGVDDVINIASRRADVLEVVDMSADVHIYFMLAEYRVEAGLHIQAFAVVLRGFGVDGVVSGNDDPVFFCGGQYGVYPGKLLL